VEATRWYRAGAQEGKHVFDVLVGGVSEACSMLPLLEREFETMFEHEPEGVSR
jgi:hypothetical protein